MSARKFELYLERIEAKQKMLNTQKEKMKKMQDSVEYSEFLSIQQKIETLTKQIKHDRLRLEMSCEHVWVEYDKQTDGNTTYFDCICPICNLSECFEAECETLTEGRKTTNKEKLCENVQKEMRNQLLSITIEDLEKLISKNL